MQTLNHPLHVLNNNTGDSISLWMEEEIASYPPLNNDLTTDVCVVGGGIAGLTCAYFLAKRGLSVTVIEGGSLGGGQTSRTTAHLAWSLDDHFFELERLFGLEGARLAAESHLEAIRTIERIVQAEGINCDFEKVDAYLFSSPEGCSDILEKEWATLQRMKVPVKQIKRAPIPFDTGPCLQFLEHGQFHIFKYLKGLVKAILENNGKIFTHTHVHRIQDGSPCYVVTDHHQIISAKSVIVATNAPINDRFMIHSKQAPYRTYAIAGRIPKNSLTKALYYDTLDPYHYVRLQKHDSDPLSEWLIIGGEDHKTGQEEDVFDIYQRLENWSQRHFPMLQKIEYRWSGQVIEPMDGLAFIGRNPHDEHVYIVTGDSGHGITHGTIAGLLLTDLITTGFHPWAELYNPARKTLQAAGEYAKENLNVAAQYGDWLMPGEMKSIEQIPPGSGAIIREGLKKFAVYRDEQGNLHSFSAVCPHLGCMVKWNPGEKSWDCPCHGSRFNVKGQVLNGPAIDPLTPAPRTLKD